MAKLFGVRRKKRGNATKTRVGVVQRRVATKVFNPKQATRKTNATMPPAISDDENDDEIPDIIPAKKGKAKADPEPEVDDEDDDEEEGEDEYRVEKILAHDFLDDGSVVYQIKWLGYEEATDLTWEPIENLEGAKDILTAYHNKIGGPPEAPPPKSAKKGRGKRTSTAAALDSPAPTSTKKAKGRKSNGFVEEEPAKARELPVGSWDERVLRVHSVIEESVPVAIGKKGQEKTERQLIGLIEWNDPGPKTQHKMKVLRQKIPQRLLDYYEQHLVFQPTNSAIDNIVDKAEEVKDEMDED